MTTIETIERTTVITTKSTKIITSGMLESSAIGASIGPENIDPTWIGTEPQTRSEEHTGAGVTSVKSTTIAMIAADHKIGIHTAVYSHRRK